MVQRPDDFDPLDWHRLVKPEEALAAAFQNRRRDLDNQMIKAINGSTDDIAALSQRCNGLQERIRTIEQHLESRRNKRNEVAGYPWWRRVWWMVSGL